MTTTTYIVINHNANGNTSTAQNPNRHGVDVFDTFEEAKLAAGNQSSPYVQIVDSTGFVVYNSWM